MSRQGQDSIEKVRAATDIVDLIGAYIPLKKAGKSFKARCPFHEEKTPSFTVSHERQTYHCFGCQERGSAFDFVMKMERVEFRDALELLADKAGITLDTWKRDDGERSNQKPDLYRLHQWALDFFVRALQTPDAAHCRSYLEKRALTPEIQQAWDIGYAPGGWTALCSAATGAGFGTPLLEAAGLALPGSKRPGHYDRFRDRLIFPIRDALNRVVAFGARALDGGEPKYLNSPETEIFSKGRTLYGLEHLKHHRKGEPLLVMEGYTDVIMSSQVGVKGCIATLGTALTPDHARLLSRYADRVVLLYDGDSAGLAAAERGALLLLEAGYLHIEAVVLPEGEDPCEWFSQHGEAGQQMLLERTRSLLDFLLERSAARHDLESMEGRRQAAKELLRAAASVEDPIGRELVLERIAEALSLSMSVVREGAALARQPARRGTRSPGKEEGAPASGAPAAQPSTARGRAQRDLVEALLNAPDLLGHPELLACDVEGNIPHERCRDLLGIWLSDPAGTSSTPGRLLTLIEDDELRDRTRRMLLPDEHGLDLKAQLEGALECLKNGTEQDRVLDMVRQVEQGAQGQFLEQIMRSYKSRKGSSSGPSQGGASL